MTPSKWQPRIYAVVLLAIAAALLIGGGQLALLGGSLYYLLAGLALAASALLMWQQRREALAVYAAIVAVTIAWSLWEAGFDGWALMPRLGAWFVVGAWLTTPIFRRNLKPASGNLVTWRSLAMALAGGVLLGAALHAINPAAVDPRFQMGTEALPNKRLVLEPAAISSEWLHWGNDQGGSRFSPLEQITPANVGGLQQIWSAPLYKSADGKTGGLEVTPLMVGDTLYACNNLNETIAIDAETGAQRWVHAAEGAKGRSCRGVAYYKAPGATGLCAERILTATNTAKLVAMDAATGQLCEGFGDKGRVNLLEGLSKAPEGYYHVSSAPALVRGKLVIGGWVTDGQFWGEPSGVIRAFDAVTGKLSWAWDMGKPDRTGAPPPGETYTPATPNRWAPISADEKLGLVYLPTGNATPDFYGAQRRPFDDRFNSSVIALDAETGRLRWSFQTTHHDIWDYDVASQPTLVDLPGKGGKIQHALVQPTKRGEIFVLNRETGQPIHPVTEVPVPQGHIVPGEYLSKTQPFSNSLPSFRGSDVREADMWGITPLDQLWCRIQLRSTRYAGSMTPPGTTTWLQSPGYVGGMNWGSGSVDPERGVAVVTTMKLVIRNQLIPRSEADSKGMKPLGSGATGLEVGAHSPQSGTPYAVLRNAFMSPLQMPCQAPPFGYISAVDLVTGKLVWSRPLGDQMGMTIGTPIVGGSITTRAGLVFVGGTIDKMFRALDLRTGKELWRANLPEGGHTVPATYISQKSGRQIVVIAAGGAMGLGSAHDARLVAFALPQKPR